MAAYVALLRGINVGGRKKIPMAELRDCLSTAGLEDVTTYIQSGNVVFTTSITDEAETTTTIEAPGPIPVRGSGSKGHRPRPRRNRRRR